MKSYSLAKAKEDGIETKFCVDSGMLSLNIGKLKFESRHDRDMVYNAIARLEEQSGFNAIPFCGWFRQFPKETPTSLVEYFVMYWNFSVMPARIEVIVAYYDSNKNAWCYPHSFGTKVEGTVIAWADKIGGYNERMKEENSKQI